jgi:nicotinic acid mononucleotide adenylyltransferase
MNIGKYSVDHFIFKFKILIPQFSEHFTFSFYIMHLRLIVDDLASEMHRWKNGKNVTKKTQIVINISHLAHDQNSAQNTLKTRTKIMDLKMMDRNRESDKIREQKL